MPNIDLGGIGGSSSAAAVGSGFAREGGVGAVMAGVPSMPAMPSPAAPMSGGGGGGGGSRSQGPSFAATNSGGDNSYAFTAADWQAAGLGNPVTINVAGGISSAADIGRSVVDALTQYSQVYGPLDLAIR